MLNVNEIRNLENRWKKYKRKKLFLSLVLPIFFIFIVVGAVGYFYFFNTGETKSYKQITKVETNNSKNSNLLSREEPKKNLKKESKKSDSDKLIKKHTKDKKVAIKIDTTAKKKNKKEQNATVKADNTAEDTISLNTNFLQRIYKQGNISEENTAKQLTKTDKPMSLKVDNNLPKKESSITESNKTSSNLTDKTPKKPKIIISSKKIDKIRYLKDRYLESNKAKYAIMLAKEYYLKKDYKDALKWAVISNSSDSDNEDSWILFAKCKVKLGKKYQAINALSAYLKVNSSKKIETLLVDIKNGVFK